MRTEESRASNRAMASRMPGRRLPTVASLFMPLVCMASRTAWPAVAGDGGAPGDAAADKATARPSGRGSRAGGRSRGRSAAGAGMREQPRMRPTDSVLRGRRLRVDQGARQRVRVALRVPERPLRRWRLLQRRRLPHLRGMRRRGVLRARDERNPVHDGPRIGLGVRRSRCLRRDSMRPGLPRLRQRPDQRLRDARRRLQLRQLRVNLPAGQRGRGRLLAQQRVRVHVVRTVRYGRKPLPRLRRQRGQRLREQPVGRLHLRFVREPVWGGLHLR
jgi:hypothetical protein